MKQLKAVLLAVVALGMFAAFAASASASLPSILTLSGGEAEITTKGTLTGSEIAKFNSTFASIKANSVSVTLAGKNMASLGSATIVFKESSLGGSPCQTEGAAEGEVKIPSAEWHIVLVGTEYFILILITKFKVNCNNGIKFTTEGSVLNKVNSSGDVTSFKTATECESAGSRKAKFKSYSTDTGTGTASLKSNAGLGNEETCEELKSELTSTSGEMYELMEP